MADTPVTPIEAPPKSSLMFKLGIVLFVAMVVGAECVTAYLFLPAMGSGSAAAAAPAASPEHEHGAPAEAAHGEKGGH